MCKCSELDWSGIDQTAEHHPDCAIVCRYESNVNLSFSDLARQSIEFSKEIIGAVNNLRTISPSHIIEKAFYHHVGNGVVEMVSDEDTHTKEACEARWGIASLPTWPDNAENELTRMLAANSRFVILAVIDGIERDTEAGRKLKRLLKGE